MNDHPNHPMASRNRQAGPIRCVRSRKESYRGSGKLKGKKAVITGADIGIGRAVALAFAREGADV